MVFRKLKRVWSHNHANHIPNFKEVFPELSKLDPEEMCDRWEKLGVDFYTDKKVKVSVFIRLTIFFGLLLILLMIISLPIVYIITGQWGYNLNDKNYVYNYLKALRLI